MKSFFQNLSLLLFVGSSLSLGLFLLVGIITGWIAPILGIEIGNRSLRSFTMNWWLPITFVVFAAGWLFRKIASSFDDKKDKL